jgi:hypothetical protein
MCTFDAIRAAWPILAESVPRELWGITPFFRLPSDGPAASWRPLVTADFANWVRAAAAAAGLDPAPFGSRALRMGGDTDLYDLSGSQSDRFKERGRWESDVAQIYHSVSTSEHGEMSRLIGDADGRDLQSLLRGWSQPAISHGRGR